MKAIQRWASWAERYGEINWYMRPFRRILYREVRKEYEHRRVRISSETRMVVRLYQALLALTVVREQSFTRTLSSFVQRQPKLTIQFDGSLTGIGVTWFKIEDGTEALLGGAAVCLRGWEFGGDSSYQKWAEFAAVVVGVVGAIQMGWDTSAIWLRGYSVTAITWAEEGRFRSDRVLRAATVMAMIGAQRDVQIAGTELLSSEENWLCDGQSRWDGMEGWEELMRSVGGEDGHIRGMEEVGIRSLPRLLELCDPRAGFGNEEEFGHFWRGVLEFVGQLAQEE